MEQNTIEHQYLNLLKDILDNGVLKKDRTGTGTISVFGRQIRHDMKLGFPLLTTKKLHFKSIVGELLWFLKGSTDIRELWKDDIKIWDGDWYKNYETTCTQPYSLNEIKDKVKNGDHYFHDSMFDLGPIYGKQWRSWGEEKQMDLDTSTVLRVENGIEKHPYKEFISKQGIDQIANLINDLKTNPDSRRLMVNAWNVGELDSMVLPPCHFSWQMFTRELSLETRYNIWFNNNYETGRERFFDPNNLPDFDNPYYTPTPTRSISLMWDQRSVDTFLGLPFNIASYALLLEIIAKEVNMVPDELIGNLGDVHLYLNHIEQAKEQLNREPFKLPTLQIKQHSMDEPSPLTKPQYWNPDDFVVENYQSHPPIKAPLSN